jgi:hypothetical protein
LRCVETRYLEVHRLQPFARNGAHEASNLALRCAAHNALAAEEDFGKDLVAERRCSSRHQAFAQQGRASPSGERASLPGSTRSQRVSQHGP